MSSLIVRDKDGRVIQSVSKDGKITSPRDVSAEAHLDALSRFCGLTDKVS